MMSAAKVEANAKAYKAAAAKIRECWNDISKKQIPALTSSWAGKDAATYIEQVQTYEVKITAACEALDLLAETFNKASTELNKKVEELANQVQKL